MSWINLAAERWWNGKLASDLVEYQRKKPHMARLGRGPALNALMAGKQDLFSAAVSLATEEFSDLQRLRSKELVLPEVLPNLLGLSVVFHIAGEDQSQLWEKIASVKAPKDKHMGALHGLVGELCGSKNPPARKGPEKDSVFRSLSELLRILDKAPLRNLFDLVMCPDSDLWPYELDSFALPLGLMHFFDQQSLDRNPDIFEFFRLGGFPDRHREVVYEREWKRPDHDVVPVPRNRETWCGIDAIEFSGESLICYHYLTMKWQAPLIFDKELNAFYFLDQLDNSWEFVRGSVSAAQWSRIEKSLSDGCCEHVIVHDSKRAPCFQEHLKRAAEHYGLNLAAKDIVMV